MARSTLLAISGLLGAGLFCSIGGCGSDEAAEPPAVPRAGQAGSTVMPIPNGGMAGRGPAGSGATMAPNTNAGTGASGSGGQAGAAGGGSGGQSAGRGGAGAGMGGAGGAAGSNAEDDPFGLNGLFGDPGAPSCEGLLCIEAADCAALYPDETAACKFTKCEDFFCK